MDNHEEFFTKYYLRLRRFDVDVLPLFHRALHLFCGNRLERGFHRLIIGVGFNG